jgi:hypothetical protein
MVNDTTKTGSIDGQNVVIKGSGFSLDITKISVSVDGVNCIVTESTLSEIKCKLEKKTTQNSILSTSETIQKNAYESGSGFFYQRYDNTLISPKTIAKFKELLDAGTIDPTTLLDSGVRG